MKPMRAYVGSTVTVRDLRAEFESGEEVSVSGQVMVEDYKPPGS